MSVVFFGASELGFKCCQKLIESGIEVSRIFTIPENFSIKYKDEKERKKQTNVLYKDFRFFEEKYGVPVKFVEQGFSEYESDLANLNPDLFVVIGWYYMIPKKLLSIPKNGSIAIHASLLPKYRGNAPLVWALINGEKETGISVFYLEGGVDEGDLIEQVSFPIENTDTIKDLLHKTENASLNIIDKVVKDVLKGKSIRIKQDNAKATCFPKRTPEDGLIDWNWDKEKIKRFIRAQTKPYPGAYTIINGKKIIIWDADIID